MSIYGKSDLEILREIAMRLKRRRLNINMSQQVLAERAGLSRTTVSYIEQGEPFGVLTLIQILRAMDALEDLASFLPDPGISPLQLARMKGRERRRAYTKSSERDVGGTGGGKGKIDENGEPEW